jgi:hypothetical protein
VTGQLIARSETSNVRRLLSGTRLNEGAIKTRALNPTTSRILRYPVHKLTLATLLRGLCNHCFPVDFRSQLPLKLKRCQQGQRKVGEFVFELEELSR